MVSATIALVRAGIMDRAAAVFYASIQAGDPEYRGIWALVEASRAADFEGYSIALLRAYAGMRAVLPGIIGQYSPHAVFQTLPGIAQRLDELALASDFHPHWRDEVRADDVRRAR